MDTHSPAGCEGYGLILRGRGSGRRLVGPESERRGSVMAESPYTRREMEQHPEPEYINDLRMLRRFVQNGSFGYRQSDDVVFQTLKSRYPEAYNAFGKERRRETL